MSSSASSAVRKQLLRALSLLTADAKAAKVPLPVPFLSYHSFGGGDRSSSWRLADDDDSFFSTSTLFSPSSPSNRLLRAALGDDLDGERMCPVLIRARERERGNFRRGSVDEQALLFLIFENHERKINELFSFLCPPSAPPRAGRVPRLLPARRPPQPLPLA